MRLSRLALALLLHQTVQAARPVKRHYGTHDYYVLEHNPAADASLDECAAALGVEVVEQAGELEHHWLVRTEKDSLARRDADAQAEDRVLRALAAMREKASSTHDSRDDVRLSKRVAGSVRYLERQTLRQRVKRAPPPIQPGPHGDAPTSEEVARKQKILDPEFGRQWHLVNDDFPQYMMNVTELWERGITGKGVVTTLVDDGLDYTSDDLAANFYAEGSHDYNDHEDLPTPKLFDDHHGTRCAGQIAAVKNDVCGVGIAYESKVAGVRILSGAISDVDEAASLNFGYQNASIYSCSWGPPDDGRSMEGPNYLVKKAMVNGITKGRGGLGSVFVFASGNGGRNGDQCNFDGYTNSIFSITVAAVDYKGAHPPYSEACAANMVVASSSGSGNHITTTDVGKNKCAHSHGGTSAAAPNAAGVFALALSARPDLNWRDMQHLCVQTAQKINPDDPDWETTATGHHYSYKYGYGALNGVEYVNAALNWKSVKPQGWIDMPTIQIANGTMDVFHNFDGGEPLTRDGVSSKMTVTPELMRQNNLEKLEHITVKVWIEHTRRGDVEVELISPNGIKSVLAGRRHADAANTGYPGWQFSTVKHWDENPVGDWTLRVSDQGKEGEHGKFLGWTMSLWGSVIDPALAKPFEAPLIEGTLPPLFEDKPVESPTPSTNATKTLPKPTAHLPGDHGDAPGETHEPAFPGNGTNPVDAVTSPSATSTPTPDEGWFSDLSKLVTSQAWFFVALGAVALFGTGVAIFFWRRSVRRRKNYQSVPAGDEMSMSNVREGRSGPRSKELYAAFDEESDGEDADEETGLRRPTGDTPVGLGYHSGFLEDDDPASAGGPPTRYKDEPDDQPPRETKPQHEQQRSDSPGSGSGDWEHASQEHASSS